MDEIELFAEITCPFTHVGLHRLIAERERLGRSTPRLRVRAWPLELVNGEPLDGGGVAEKADVLRGEVAPELFGGVDATNWPTSSLPAFALVEAAYRRDAATGEAVSLAVRVALFEEGQDISDSAVLAEVAAEYGIGPVTGADNDAIEADWNEGKRRNVVGSPHFFLGNHDVFCPTLDITRPNGELHIEIDQPAFDAFIAAVFE